MLRLIDSESLSYSASMASKSSLTYPRIQVRHRRDADYKDGFSVCFAESRTKRYAKKKSVSEGP